MSEPFIGQIVQFAGNFAPRGWAFCDGQLLAISEHPALFAILGTTYGGDGRTTFALPDLRGRVAIHEGQGPGLTNRRLGARSGVETVALSQNQMPSHTHEVRATNEPANNREPAGNFLAKEPSGSTAIYKTSPGTTAAMANGSIGTTGAGQSHDNMQPYLAVNFIIALEGIFPSRD